MDWKVHYRSTTVERSDKRDGAAGTGGGLAGGRRAFVGALRGRAHGNSADAHALAAATGAFVNEDPVYVQSTGFVLDPDGRTVVSVYSSGAIGRLVPEDVVGLVRFEREHAVVT